MGLAFELFFTFFKIGLFTIGGGYAMIPMIQAEVSEKGWLTMTQLVDFIAIAESTPGPFAVNIATYVGARTLGVGGAALATFGVVLPSFVIILVIARFFMAFQDNQYVKGALNGLRPAVVGLVAAAAFSIAVENLFPRFSFSHLPESLSSVNFIGLVVFIIVFLISVFPKKKLHPIFFILISAGLGIVFCMAKEFLGF